LRTALASVARRSSRSGDSSVGAELASSVVVRIFSSKTQVAAIEGRVDLSSVSTEQALASGGDGRVGVSGAGLAFVSVGVLSSGAGIAEVLGGRGLITTVARIALLGSEADTDGSVGTGQARASSDRGVSSGVTEIARTSGVDGSASSRAKRALAGSSRECVGSSGASLALVSVGELTSDTSFTEVLGGRGLETTVARVALLGSEAKADGSVGTGQARASSDRGVSSGVTEVTRTSGVDGSTSSRAKRALAGSSRESVGSSGTSLAFVSVGELTSDTSFTVVLGGRRLETAVAGLASLGSRADADGSVGARLAGDERSVVVLSRETFNAESNGGIRLVTSGTLGALAGSGDVADTSDVGAGLALLSSLGELTDGAEVAVVTGGNAFGTARAGDAGRGSSVVGVGTRWAEVARDSVARVVTNSAGDALGLTEDERGAGTRRAGAARAGDVRVAHLTRRASLALLSNVGELTETALSAVGAINDGLETARAKVALCGTSDV
jgi:hypothetical protein